MTPQRFESKRQVVEAVQLTADADWEAIADWCGGTVCERSAEMSVPDGDFAPGTGDWVIRLDADTFTAETEAEFQERFHPAANLDGVAAKLRQALEDTTPGPWTRYCLEEPDSKEWIINETTGLELAYLGDVFDNDEQAEATAALIAAAPVLLAQAADRIEQLEAENERLRGITLSEVEAEALDEILSKPSQFADRLAETRAAVESRRITKEGA